MRIKAIVSGVALVAVVSACGSNSSTGKGPKVETAKRSPVELVAGAAEATSQAKTARINIDMKMSGDALATLGQDSVHITMDGRVALDGSTAEFTMDLGALIPGAGGGTVQALMVDGTMYMDMGAMMKALAGGIGEDLPPSLAEMKWVKIDTGSTLSANSSPASFTQYLEYLRGASKNGVTELDPETIDGTKTRHFHAEIELATAMAKAAQSMTGASKALREQFEQSKALFRGLDEIPVDVWIDEDGLPRRMTMKLDIAAAGQSMSMDMRMDMTDFGVDVSDIEAPDADEVTDMSSLQGLLS